MKTTSMMIAVMFAFTMMATNVMGQTTDEGQIDVNVTVEPFVEIEVIDSSFDVDVAGTSGAEKDFGGGGLERALFEVRANADYSLLVESSTGTWQASNLLSDPYDQWAQVKFESGDGDFIGGGFYLDRNPENGSPVTHYTDGYGEHGPAGSVPAETTNFSGGAGHTGDELGPEVHTWGLSAAFEPELYGDAANPNGIEGQVAPPKTYSSIAQITASLD